MESLHPSEQGHNTPPAASESGNTNADAALKEKYRRLFQRGLRWLGMGIVLMALSFGVNFFMFQSDQSFVTIMYVLTTLGTVCIIKGLADVLGF